jgi:hypothetical protein
MIVVFATWIVRGIRRRWGRRSTPASHVPVPNA